MPTDLLAQLAQGDDEPRDLLTQLGADDAPLTAESAAVPPQPWYAQPLRQLGLAARAGAEGVAALPMMAADFGVAARTLGENVAGGARTYADITRKTHEMPSESLQRGLTATGLPEPKNNAEKVGRFITSTLAGAALPGAKPLGDVPSNFIRPDANPTAAILRKAREAGYVVPPATANPSMLNKAVEGLAGKISTAQAASVKNQQLTDDLVREAGNLKPGEPITRSALEGVRKVAGKVYDQVAKSGTIVSDHQYLDDLTKLGSGADEVAAAFPGANVGNTEKVSELVDSLLQDKFEAGPALQYLRELRKTASANLSFTNSGDPAKQALGMAQREAASTLEDLIGRHLEANGQGDLAQTFSTARKTIAISHTIENALNETTGHVVASKLGQQLAKGKPLSGNLELVAQFSRAFPKAAKEVTESMPGISPLDWMMGAGGALATGNPATLALLGARPAARAALLSPWWQQGLNAAPSSRLVGAGAAALSGIPGQPEVSDEQ